MRTIPEFTEAMELICAAIEEASRAPMDDEWRDSKVIRPLQKAMQIITDLYGLEPK